MSRLSALQKLKAGTHDESDEEEDYYDENENDNYDDMDDFVVETEDIGYKASAHQKKAHRVQRPPQQRNQYANNQPTSTTISRRRNKNPPKNVLSSPRKKQQQRSLNSYFNNSQKPSTNVPKGKRNNQKNKKKGSHKLTAKNLEKKAKDDDFMQNILDDMDDDDDDEDEDNTLMNDIEQENVNNGSMDDTEHIECDNNNTNNGSIGMDTAEPNKVSHPSPRKKQKLDNNKAHEPPRKRFRFSGTPAPISGANKAKSTAHEMEKVDEKNDKEMSDHVQKLNINNDNMDMDDGDTPMGVETDKNTPMGDDKNNEPMIESCSQSMFAGNNLQTNNNDNNVTNNQETQHENTDDFPKFVKGFVNFYWFDAYEDPFRKPGQVFLFGKTLCEDNTWQSVCVKIANIERNIYVLPKLKNKNDGIDGERIEFQTVYQEIEGKRRKLRIKKLACKPTKMKYCFRERANGVPEEATYLNVKYSFAYDSFNGEERGNTYSHIFGIRANALELFILNLQIMGPCWLRIPFQKAPMSVSWCKMELQCDDPCSVRVLSTNYPAPSLKVLSLAFQTVWNDKKQHEVACISGVVQNAVKLEQRNNEKTTNTSQFDSYFSLVRKIDRNPFPYDLEQCLNKKGYKVNANTLKKCASERELLSFFAMTLDKLDPDVVVAHKLYDFMLDVLLHRMDKLNVNDWSRIGRLRKGKMPLWQGRLQRKYLGSGRLLCDTFLSSQELISEKTYTLSYLSKKLLKVENHVNLDSGKIAKQWYDGKMLSDVICHCCNDANLVMKLMFHLQILPLTKELTNLCGNLWSRSLMQQRAERNEWLLLHEFNRNGYILPEKLTKKEKIAKGILKANVGGSNKRQKAQYSGGLVLEPQRGLYDKFVLCLDFNSLYPSIVEEYNLCFTTIDHWVFNNENASKGDDEAATAGDREQSMIAEMQQSIKAENGVLPKVIGVLLTRRSAVKKILKSSKSVVERNRLDVKQKALKLVANSMYGCLGFSFSRFYCKPIAMLITAFGRENLMKASTIAQTFSNLRVIYGDTDSIFVYTDCDDLLQARSYASDIKKKINRTYNKMYLELDYVYSKILLLRKKKYAAVKVLSHKCEKGKVVCMETAQEIKGLDLVRRDWSIISKEIGKEILDIILSDSIVNCDAVVSEIVDCLSKYKQLSDDNKIALAKFVITKKLTKKPSDYPDPTKQPHVMVAIAMQKLGRNVNVGSFIEYIVCTKRRDGSDSKSVAQRAYHICEIENSMKNSESDALVVDREWYLEQQILPPIVRYCSPIEGVDMGQLAKALGLSSSKYAQNHSSLNAGNDNDQELAEQRVLSIVNPRQRYLDFPSLKIKCRHCNNVYDFVGVYNLNLNGQCGLICPSKNCVGIVNFQNANAKCVDLKCLKNLISLQVFEYLQTYYARKWCCNDLSCKYWTRQISNDLRCPKLGCTGVLCENYNASHLFSQFRYFAYLFDVEQQTVALNIEFSERSDTINKQTLLNENQINAFNEINGWIKQHVLEHCRYYFIDSNAIFKYLS